MLKSILPHIYLPPISLLSMSMAGAVMITIIMLIRAAAIHKLPKSAFWVLWGIVLLRLLIPVSIPSRYSIYSLSFADSGSLLTDQINSVNSSSHADTISSADSSTLTDKITPENNSSHADTISSVDRGSPLTDKTNLAENSSPFTNNNLPGNSSLHDNSLLTDQINSAGSSSHTDTIRSASSGSPFADKNRPDPEQRSPQSSYMQSDTAKLSRPAWYQNAIFALHTAYAKLTAHAEDFPLQIIWLIGLNACALFFIASYIKCTQIFSMSLPVDNSYTKNWQNSHKIKRRITVRQSGFITAPLTYGILHPVILMPKGIDWEDTSQLAYIFAHEYVHIRRFDAIYKLVLTAACCIHWFNPLVWAMYLLASQDIELSCDEAVIHAFGEAKKSAYAMALIRMEEKKSGFTPLCSRFSKNKAEERITAIMKMKKTNILKTTASCILIAGITFTFATTAAAQEPPAAQKPPAAQEPSATADPTPISNAGPADQKYGPRTDSPKLADAPKLSDLTAKNLTPVPGTQFTGSEYKKLAALCFDNFQNMTISAFRSKVWDIIDTEQYLDLLDRLTVDETIYEQKDSHPAAYFLHYILTPLTAEKKKSISYGGYTSSACQNALDFAAFEYDFQLIIQNEKILTVKQYDDTRRNVVNAIETFFYGRTLDQLKNQKQMKAAIKSEIPHLENEFSSNAVSVSFTDWYFSPLFVNENPSNQNPSNQNPSNENPSNNAAGSEFIYPAKLREEPRTFPDGGRRTDYAAILSLKTDHYKKDTVKKFNAALDKCTDSFSLDDLAAIWEDITHDDYKVKLTAREKDFLAVTYTLSTLENITAAKSRNQHTKKQPVVLQQDLGIKTNTSQDTCSLWYQFGYKVLDPDRLTIEARDKAVVQFKADMEQFWKKNSLKKLVSMTEQDMLSYLNKTAAKYSSDSIKLIIYKDHVLFQPQKGPKDEF